MSQTGRARILKRTPLSGRFASEPLEVQRHAADPFAAYALGDESDWTMAGQHLSGKRGSDDPLRQVKSTMMRWCRLRLSIRRPSGRLGWSAIWPSIGQWGPLKRPCDLVAENEEHAAGHGKRHGCC